MALRAIDHNEHSRLLKKANDAPFKKSKAAQFEEQLTKLYEEYNTLLVDLSVVIINYREVAAKINARQPLVKRKEPQETDLRSHDA